MKTRRSILERQALFEGLVNYFVRTENSGERGSGPSRSTYSAPVKKIADTPTFRLTDICNRQINHMGTLSIAMSEIMLKMAEE